jgi:hypothetical protein
MNRIKRAYIQNIFKDALKQISFCEETNSVICPANWFSDCEEGVMTSREGRTCLDMAIFRTCDILDIDKNIKATTKKQAIDLIYDYMVNYD